MTTTSSDRPFDFIIYGATGYTGKKVAKYVLEKYPSLSMAIAGRSEEKLQKVAKDIGLSQENIFVASLDDIDTLVTVLQKGRIVLACAGPYRSCGMPLVKASILAQTDYLDLCGEPQFFDDTLVQCEDDARTSNTLIISACAFDCVPAELSAAFVANEVQKRYGGDVVVSGIEICHTFEGVAKANATTFHAAVDGFHAGMNGELKQSRNKVNKKFNMGKTPKRPENWPKVPQQPGNIPTYHERSQSYTLKFPGADAAAIMASWRYLRLRQPSEKANPRLSVCFGCPTQMTSMKVLAYGAVFSSLARFGFGCNWLHKNPSLFSNGVFDEDGPTEEELSKGSFCTYSTGYGSSEKEVVHATCKGPEPGYVATPRILVALAITVLRHKDKLPFQGGVVLPGALFGNCQEAYDAMKENDVVIEVVKDDDDGNVVANV